MASIAAIRAALASQISQQIPGLRAAATVPGEVSPPAVVVRPARGTLIEYQQTFDGAVNLYFEAMVLAATASDRTGQSQLDGFLSPVGANSVFLAVQHDTTLGGVVSAASVIRADGYGFVNWAGVEYLSSTLIVEVMSP